jgi:hypothetical protein
MERPQANLDNVLTTLSTWAGNFQRNTRAAFVELRAKDYIRLVVIIGAYLLLRPYLVKAGARAQEKSHARREDPVGAGSEASMSVDTLRDGRKVDIPGVDGESEEENEAGSGEVAWGRKARVRQRNMIREKVEEHERRLREQQMTESDKEIEEFLVDD